MKVVNPLLERCFDVIDLLAEIQAAQSHEQLQWRRITLATTLEECREHSK